jgi:Tannase and feruloyl esterase
MVRPVFSQQSTPGGAVPSGEARCPKLVSLQLADAKVTSAEVMTAGAGVTGVSLPRKLAAGLPAFCRVRLTDRPSSDSDIKTEIWLPVAGWNSRYLGQGNGGFAGEIAYEYMADAVREGYATAGTDTGHVGPTPTFALGHPEKVKDFGWRAIHDMTVEAKAVAAAFYGKAAAHTYFESCSDGGREALMEAQRFPADYDGIVAGAPAYNWTALTASGAVDTKAILTGADAFIPPGKVAMIAAAVNAQCDALDGVADGVVNDPRICRFDPETLACKDGGDASKCLTTGQVATLKTIYSAKVDAKGSYVYPGFLPGAEDGRGGWVPWITGGVPGQSLFAFFGHGYFSNFVHEQADWELTFFDFDKDYALANEKTAAALNATDRNLKPFVARGGKLILYHGWNDPAIPALGTIDYYDGAVKVLGARVAADSLRLYMVPGMQHCGGGPGATEFNGGPEAAERDAEHDVTTALEEWVEMGKAPGTLIARSGDAAGDGFTRPLCVYPAVARYVGGDSKVAASFVCSAAGK